MTYNYFKLCTALLKESLEIYKNSKMSWKILEPDNNFTKIELNCKLQAPDFNLQEIPIILC